jgi:hypothetical protein
MPKAIRIIRYVLIFMLVIVLAGCAANKNPYYKKRNSSNKVSTSQLGRNKYYFSPTYQKKLKASYKKK